MKKLEGGKVAVSIDPGYDSTKVCVNTDFFSIPKKTVKKIGEEYETFGKLNGVYEIELKDEPNEGTYLCGPKIHVLISDNKQLHQRLDKDAEQNTNFAHFATKEFKANTFASLAIALIRAEDEGIIELGEFDSSKLHVFVALPHDALVSMSDPVSNMLIGEHRFCFRGTDVLGTKEYIEKDFEITIIRGDMHLIVGSQILASLYGHVLDEDGNEAVDLQEICPAIINDGGYLTVADLGISETMAITGATSNMHYGMYVIYSAVAEEINKVCGTDFKEYDMENIFRANGGRIIIPKTNTKSGKNEPFDCNPILETEEKRIFEEYLAYMEVKYEYFTNYKTYFFVGGIGEVFYKHFMQIKDTYNNITPVLISYKLGDHDVTPREAICAGGYKTILSRI